MQILTKALAFAASLAAAASLQASLTITFNMPGFGDETGTPTDGMYYAIIADTAGDGFDFSHYSTFDITQNEQFLPTLEGVTDDLYLFGSDGLTQTLFAPPLQAHGVVSSIATIPYNTSLLSPNDEFGLIWFADNAAEEGNAYGFVRGSDWLIGSNGDAISGLETVSPGAASYTIVPEPGAYAAALGALALGFVGWRRRRK